VIGTYLLPWVWAWLSRRRAELRRSSCASSCWSD
jgi:hypothetical protein